MSKIVQNQYPKLYKINIKKKGWSFLLLFLIYNLGPISWFYFLLKNVAFEVPELIQLIWWLNEDIFLKNIVRKLLAFSPGKHFNVFDFKS